MNHTQTPINSKIEVIFLLPEGTVSLDCHVVQGFVLCPVAEPSVGENIYSHEHDVHHYE